MIEKLNLGCGKDIREGYTNLDYVDFAGVDVVHNWDNLPLPFPDERFDEILMLDVLEHIPHRVTDTDGEFFLAFVNDLIRISDDGATWIIESPRHPNALRSSCHTRIISPVTFEPWRPDASHLQVGLENHIVPKVLVMVENKRLWCWNLHDLSRFGRCFRNRLTFRVVRHG